MAIGNLLYYGGFNGKIIYKWWIVHCHVWLPEVTTKEYSGPAVWVDCSVDSIGNCWSRHKVDKTPKSPLHAAYICWIGYRNSNIFKFQYADSRCLSLKPLPLHFAHLALASPCPASLSKTSPLPTAIPSWKALDAERKILQDPCADFWMFGCLVIPESWWFRDQNPTFLLISIAISVSCGIIFCLQSVGYCFFSNTVSVFRYWDCFALTLFHSSARKPRGFSVSRRGPQSGQSFALGAGTYLTCTNGSEAPRWWKNVAS